MVDDAQWLDGESALTLAFVARRVQAESLGLVFAVREPSEAKELDGLPEVRLRGLREDDARAVLSAAWPTTVRGNERTDEMDLSMMQEVCALVRSLLRAGRSC